MRGYTKEKVDHIGKTEHYQGKPRAKHMGYDRKDGTGRGRGLPKDGHGKGNWGNIGEEARANSGATAEALLEGSPKKATEAGETKPEEANLAEGMEKPPVEGEGTKGEEAYQDAPEEEEAKGKMTLEEYLASKKKGVNMRKEARAPEENKKGNLEQAGLNKEKVETRTNKINAGQTYNVAVTKGEDTKLLGFQGGDDYIPREGREFREGREGGSRGGRGGRGRGARGGAPTGEKREQRKQGGGQNLQVNEEAFPAL